MIVDLGRDPVTGKRRQLWRGVKGTKRDAETLLVQLLHQRDTGIDTPPGKLIVGDYLERWLRDYAEANTAPKTLLRYEEVVRLHLTPALGALPLTKLRPLHIQEAYGMILAKGLSPRTVLHCHRVLREALQHALRWQLVARNAADAVEPPRPQRYEARALGLPEVGAIVAAASSTQYAALVELAVMTGLRKGELLGLRWEDLDLEDRTLRVRQVCQWLPRRGFIFRAPKTRGSRRAVALPPHTAPVLRQHRAKQAEQRLALGAAYDDQNLVFATPLGTPIDPSNLRRAWKLIVDQAGIGHVRFHDLRHAHATLLLSDGVHPKVVAERLGHSGVGITLDIYSHVLPTLQVEAAERLGRLLAPARKGS